MAGPGSESVPTKWTGRVICKGLSNDTESSNDKMSISFPRVSEIVILTLTCALQLQSGDQNFKTCRFAASKLGNKQQYFDLWGPSDF